LGKEKRKQTKTKTKMKRKEKRRKTCNPKQNHPSKSSNSPKSKNTRKDGKKIWQTES
jgi:hypothetical protein